MPQIATSEMQATPSPSSSQVPPAGQAAEQSFSAILAQANSSVLAQAKSVTSQSFGAQAGLTHIAPQGSYPPISDALKRDAKKPDSKSVDPKMAESKQPDSKTSSSQSHGNPISQITASSPDPLDQTVPALVVPTPPLPLLALPVGAWGADLQNFTLDPHVGDAIVGNAIAGNAKNDHGISSATSGIEPAANAAVPSGATSLPKLFKGLSNDAAEAKPLSNTSSQDLPTPASTKSAGTKSTTAGTVNSEAAASLVAKLPSTAASDPKPSSGGVPAPAQAHNVSRGAAETTDGDSKTSAAVKSEIEQVLVPPASVLLPSIPSITGSGNADSSNSPGTAAKPASDKTRVGTTQGGMTQIGMTQDSVATTGKNAEVTGSAKAQTRKDDSQSSSNSPAPDQTMVSTPAKTIDSSQGFSVSGTQTSPATGDGKAATDGVPHGAGDPKAGQLDQTSTAVTQSQQGEPAAAYPTSLVHSAKLVERVGEAELRLGIRAGEFGSVDVRTSMVRNQFTAEISTERGELGRAMAAELPSLQNRLAEQRVPVANITLQNQTGNQSTASEQQRPRDGQRMYATNSGSGREDGPMSAMVALEGTTPTSGLDIHM